MIKPKEQAKKLYDKYTELTKVGFGNGVYVYYHDKTKQCALIAVDEMINYLSESDWALINNKAIYWREVKQEIEKL